MIAGDKFKFNGVIFQFFLYQRKAVTSGSEREFFALVYNIPKNNEQNILSNISRLSDFRAQSFNAVACFICFHFRSQM